MTFAITVIVECGRPRTILEESLDDEATTEDQQAAFGKKILARLIKRSATRCVLSTRQIFQRSMKCSIGMRQRSCDVLRYGTEVC